MKKIFISVLFAYIIAVVQTGFMVHFFFPSLLFLYFIFFNLLETPEKNGGVIVAGVSGLFFDLLSVHFVGFYTIVFILCALLVKLILRKYVRFPSIFAQA